MKHLGQHFLINKSVIKRVVNALELQSGDTVVEIGPGHGELTAGLLNQPIRQLIAIEKDPELAENLKTLKGIDIIKGDVLKELPKLSKKIGSYKLIGNIPYYLTGFLLRIISELENKPSLTVFTIQKEVAERLTAQPPKMNLLAASVQYWAKPKLLFIIPAKDFEPEPKVDAAVIKLIPKKPFDSAQGIVAEPVEALQYYKFIKILFKQPRKTVLNNLADGLKITKEELKNRGINEKIRPQNLDIETIEKLAKLSPRI